MEGQILQTNENDCYKEMLEIPQEVMLMVGLHPVVAVVLVVLSFYILPTPTAIPALSSLPSTYQLYRSVWRPGIHESG